MTSANANGIAKSASSCGSQVILSKVVQLRRKEAGDANAKCAHSIATRRLIYTSHTPAKCPAITPSSLLTKTQHEPQAKPD